MKSLDSKKNEKNHNEDEKGFRRIVLILIILIIILLLLTKCSFDFLGQIGDPFGSSSDYTIDNGKDTLKEIYDGELRFVKQSGETFVDDVYRIEFETKKIYSSNYTCMTSDANLATCMVKDNYVEVYPKEVGEVEIFVVAQTNGYKYIGRHYLTIKDVDREIVIEPNKGTIYLDENDTMYFYYTLRNCDGIVEYDLSDKDALFVSVQDGRVLVKALKTGDFKVTLRVTYRGRTYSNTIYLTVIKNRSNQNGSGNSSGNAGNLGNEDDNGSVNVDNNELLDISLSSGKLNPAFDKTVFSYKASVLESVSTITIKTSYKNNNGKIYYYVNGLRLANLDHLSLNHGKNFVEIVLQNGDLSYKKYTIEIYRNYKNELDENNYLFGISVNKGTLTPAFQRTVNDYRVDVANHVEKITLHAASESTKATIHYVLNGEEVDHLENINLNVGKNEIKIIVTSESGNVNLYTVHIYREEKRKEDENKDGDNFLKSLTSSVGNFVPTFRKEILDYELVLNSNVPFVSLFPILNSSKAEMKYFVDDKEVMSLANISLNAKEKNVRILVLAEDGSTRTYRVNIKKKVQEDDNQLIDIRVTNGVLSPAFDSKIREYEVIFSNTDSLLSIEGIQSSPKSRLEYYVDGVKVDSLNNIRAVDGKKVILRVISESGLSNDYTLILKMKKDSNNKLKDILVNGFYLNPSFDGAVNYYVVDVDSDTNAVQFDVIKGSEKQTLIYKVDGEVVSNLNRVVLDRMNKKIEIFVTSEDGQTNKYEILVKKKIRLIRFVKSEVEIFFENEFETIYYNVFEDEKIVTNYDIHDITMDKNGFSGTIEIEKGYLVVQPAIQDIGKNYLIRIHYRNVTSTVNVSIKKKDYYVNVSSDKYTLTLSSIGNKQSMILNTNLFNRDVAIHNINNGVRLSNKMGYIDIVSSDTNIVKVNYDISDNQNVTEYLSVLLNGMLPGTANIHVVAHVLGEEIYNKELCVRVVEKYKIVLDAQDGFFNAFTTRYEYLVEKNDVIDLGLHKAYKKDQPENCLYFKLDSYNSSKEGTGVHYEPNQIITNFTEDLYLYAIYSDVSTFEEIIDTGILYLTEVDLFHNEEYYQEYNVDKIIYPGAHGYHIMTIHNQTGELITLKRLNLEEKTVCIDQLGCINMGYVIKYARSEDKNYTYYYGSPSSYTILNKDQNALRSGNEINGYENKVVVPLQDGIEIEDGEGIEISLLWEWVDVDDYLDTEIGKKDKSQTYGLKVSIEYEKQSKVCKKE